MTISFMKNYYVESDLFLVRPGDGGQFVYSPVDANATLHCAVNNTNLFWDIDGLNFDRPLTRDSLHSRKIFRTPATSQGTRLMGSLIVFGDTEANSTQICCESILILGSPQQSCTTLIIYGMINF